MNHINEYRALLWADHNPEQDAMSASSQLRIKVKTDPNFCPTLAEAWTIRESNPTTYMVNKRDYLEAARDLLCSHANTAHVILGTPVALKDLTNHATDTPTMSGIVCITSFADRAISHMLGWRPLR